MLFNCFLMTKKIPLPPLLKPLWAQHYSTYGFGIWQSQFIAPHSAILIPLSLVSSFVRYPIHIPSISHPYPIQDG